jgi:hypothetical protein
MSKKRLLIVSYKIPYPLSQGGSIAQFFFLKKMTTVFNVSFCTIVSNKNQAKNLEELKKIIPELTFKVYHVTNTGLKESFVKSIFKYLEKINRRITLKLSKIFKENANAQNICKLDKGFEFANEEFVDFFKSVLKEESYNIIQLEFFETLALLPLIPDTIKKIVVHHEIRSKRNSLISSGSTFYKNYVAKITYTIENSLLSIADSVIVFNDEDKEYLHAVNSNIEVSPFGIPKNIIIKKEVSSYFNKFIFVGSEFHFPNKEGLEWFLDSIYIPNIERLEWPLYITGFWNEAFKKKYRNYKKIIFTGFIKNLLDIYNNGILIAPIISGSGVRTKILEAFSNKIPVISTSFASEGLYYKGIEQKHIIHFETSTDFLEEFENIKKDPNLIIDLVNNGFDYFSIYFEENNLFDKRLSVYNN